MKFKSKSLIVLALLFFVALSIVLARPGETAQGGQGDNPDVISATYRGVSSAVQFDISPPLRSFPPVEVKPGDMTEIPERPSGLEGPFGPQDIDPLVQSQVGPTLIPAPLVSFDGPPNVFSVSPPTRKYPLPKDIGTM
jgi:hypothetical protein